MLLFVAAGAAVTYVSKMTRTFLTYCLSLLFLTLLTTATTAPATAPCTVCLNGHDSSYVDQSKAFTVPGLPIPTCGDLLSTVQLFTQDSPICHSIQSVGTYCGCPRTVFPCTLCENGTQPSHPLLELPNYNASDYVFGAPPNVKLNCETLDGVLNILANDTDPMCLQIRDDVGQTCGCPHVVVINNTTTINSSNKTSTKNKPTIPAKTYKEPCTLCLDASATPIFPNRSLSLGSLPVHNCHDLTNFAGLLTATDVQCMGLQSLGPYCGCPVPPGACSLCPNGETVPYPDRFANLLQDFEDLPPGLVTEVATNLTCGEFASIVAVPPPSSIRAGIDPSLLCLISQLRSGICGCTQGLRAKLITWFYRVSAMLSLVGSFSIIRDIVEKPVERRTTYHQLVFGISWFDIITSVAYMLTGILLPTYSGQYQAHGNHATCLLQGFMIQLGVTSVFYNLLLCIYFLLLVKYNWKEHRFRQYRNYVHLPILAIGIGLAGGCLPFIVPQLGFCYVSIPPISVNRIAISFFFALPTSFALLLMIICSFLMCYHVFRTELRTLRKST